MQEGVTRWGRLKLREAYRKTWFCGVCREGRVRGGTGLHISLYSRLCRVL